MLKITTNHVIIHADFAQNININYMTYYRQELS